MITYWFDLLALQDLVARNQLYLCLQPFILFSKQPIVQTSEDRRSCEHNPSPTRNKVSVPSLILKQPKKSKHNQVTEGLGGGLVVGMTDS